MMIKKNLILILLTITILVWGLLIKDLNSSQNLKIIFFDIGQGDSLFIETPSQKQILIDGGPNSLVLEKLGSQMGFWDKYIDLIILTHPDADHLTGLLEVLRYYQVGLVLVSGFEKDNQLYANWQKLIAEKKIKTKTALAGQVIDFGDGVSLKLFWPDQACGLNQSNANNCSVVGQLVYQKNKFLLTGDIEESIELKLIQTDFDLKSDVLKIGHHGSKSSTNLDFLNQVEPALAVISVGENNYGHPHQVVLDRLKDILILRTDQAGDIIIESDGQQLLLTD